MAPDIIIELNAMRDIDLRELDQIAPLFDPVSFQELHTDLTLEAYKLEEGRLEEIGR